MMRGFPFEVKLLRVEPQLSNYRFELFRTLSKASEERPRPPLVSGLSSNQILTVCKAV